MKRILWGISLLFLMAGCTLFDAPEGTVEVELGSVHTRIEQPTATEEIVYCSADLKITNIGNKTIYNCTISAVAKSDKDIEHFISFTRDVNIPPSQSIYLTAEWTLIRKIGASTETVSGTSSETYSGTETETIQGKDTEKTNEEGKTNTEGSTTTSGTTTKTDSTANTETDTTIESTIDSTTQSTSNGETTATSTTVTTITTTPAESNEETEWKKDSIKIISYFFN
ncbi:MAG: hypothetical protein J6S91_02385 [Treponema sp.]|nr:hypothetical protein [Treponema sp.]